MKNKIVVLLTSLMTTALLVACGSSDVAENTQATTVETMLETESTKMAAEAEPTEMAAETESTEMTAELTDVPETTSTEAAHEHAYTKTITTQVTCETDGEVLFTCECGDSYTESVISTGHSFETYISNNDATYTADGTETATCICGETDTRTAEGSMLAYTYTDMDATMYVQKTVNVRNIPNTDGEKIGSLSANDEVKVTGQCAETSWYRIEYSGGVAYVSDSYLGNDKVVVQAEAPSQNSNSGAPSTISSTAESANYPNVIYVNVCAGSASYSSSKPHRSLGKCVYPIDTEIDNGDGTHTKYTICNHGGHFNGAWIDFTPQGTPPNGVYCVDAYPYDEGCVHKWVY